MAEVPVMYPHKPLKSSCTSSSIPELLGALCDCSLSGVSWKRRALGGISREGFRKALKKCAYGALLSKLFQDGTKGSASGPSATANTPPRNKVLMICFDLRVAGCREEAENLEEQLRRLPEGTSSGLKELDAVLELLVNLAGSAPPPVTSFSGDYMRRERPVLRRPQPWGYQSEELQRLEARAWGLVCGVEWGTFETLCGTRRLMDAPPGTGMLALRAKLELKEKFEKETRLTLFGALHHTRTSDMDIRLDMPPAPSNIDVTGLALRVPSFLDQSEDEGFQSSSNLTPDSQSEPSPVPDVDIWEALKTFEPGRRRCWESVGCPPGQRESLYLTEGGREAFDQLYRLWEGQLRVVSTSTPSPLLPLPQDSQTQLVTDLLNVLIGVASTTFPLNQSIQFDVRPGVCVSGASPESVSRLLGELAQYGTHYLRLSRFSLQSANKKGLVFQAFTGGLRRYLHYYRACVLTTPPNLSLLTISFLFRKVGRQLRYLSELCCVDGPSGPGQATFPVGVKLLSYLYNEAQSNCSNENYPVLLSLLKSSCEPYTRFVSDWVYSGVFRDVYGEFMIQVNEEYLGFRDKHFWVQGYTLISKDVEDCVPLFLRHIANDVYVCGKTINLLKICCPQHYICWSELPVPRIAVTFSLQEVEEIERDCAVYRGRLERVAKHSAISREQQAQRVEAARQELINQVRESAAKTLESIRGRQVSQRLAEEARKRERFEELKHHLDQEQEWRNAARKQLEDDDFSFARELRDREKRLQALEEQLEQRARKELIAQYSRLSEEAARRERRAMWRVQRMRLDEARAEFFTRDRQQTEDMMEKYPLGQQRPPRAGPPYVPPAPEFPTQHPAETQQPGASSPPLNPLTSQDVIIKDFLPENTNPDSQQVDEALQETGSDLPEGRSAVQPVDYDFSAPFSPLEGITGQARPHVIQDHPSFSHITIGENVPQVQRSLPKASAFGQASNSSFALGLSTSEEPQNMFRSSPIGSEQLTDGRSFITNKQEGGQRSDAGGNESGGTEPSASDHQNHVGSVSLSCVSGAEMKDGDSFSLTVKPSAGIHGDPSDVHSHVGQFKSEETPPKVQSHVLDLPVGIRDQNPEAPLPSSGAHVHDSPAPNLHAHALDSHMIGEDVSDGVARLPSSSVCGHPSDAHIKVGENVWNVVAPLPPAGLHGHSSDANIKVGEFVSDAPEEKPRWSKHGHASDCILQTGCVVSGTEPTSSALPGNAHGHSSDSTLGVGCVVSGDEPKLLSLPGSAHGHSSDSTLEVGCVVSGNEPQHPPLPGSAHGHSSDSTLGVGCVVSGNEPQHPPLPGSAHGHSSDSTLEVGCVVSGNEPQHPPLPGSAYGHSSDSTLGVGCVVSGSEPQHPPLPGSAHGHSSDSTLGVGCVVSGNEPQHPPLPGSAHGHSSDSTLGVGCVVSGNEPQHPPLPGSAYGHSSDSTLGVGCVVSGNEPQHPPLPGSAHGHSSDSTLGVGCVVLGAEPPASTLPGSAHGHSSDSSLGVGCVVKGIVDGNQQATEGFQPHASAEQLVEIATSWTENFSLSPTEKCEREYLLSLSAQYQVEHYEDCYTLMDASPECQLLKPVTRGPWGPPTEPTLRRATDTTAVQLSEMVSLPVLIKHSVTTPIITHVSLVNKAVVDYFFVELGVEGHFEALRHFLLMEDGEFAQSLSDLLFEKMVSGQTPGELLTPLVLNSILMKALQYSLHGDTPLAANFTFALRFLPETFHPHAPDSLNCLELRYKVDWPLNIIITDSCMNKYNRLFSFLLQLKHMVWSLREVWFHLKRTGLL
ncbi:gamma-tubulin complex component 6 isoform X2 [Antennarius striatus]|uniref:gamma-tubulin complex component 6 isoform X2 n=1 Tax=Antennarius striatus TaxID=241820 RepID=UPI0035B396EF